WPPERLCLRLRTSCTPFFFSSRRRHTRSKRDWSSDVCSSDLTDSGDRLLVDRGWLPLGADASAPDAVPAPPEGQTELIIRAIPGEVSVDRGAPEGQVASINLASIREELGYDIADEAYGLMAAESPAPADAPQQMPEPQRDEGPHLSYSMQWFTFGLMSFVVWGWLAYQKAVRNREDELYGEREEDGF